jgi:hypothetical protein
MNNDKKQFGRFRRVIKNILGTVVMFGVAIAVVPEVMKKKTNATYKKKLKVELEQKDEGEWGPEITKKLGEEDGN